MPTEEVYAQFLNGTDEKYNLEDSTYLISTNMDRFALSKMLNELLNLENSVRFDFLMNDERLRGTVSEKMEELKIESESTIQLAYVLAVNDPNQKNVDNLNDWISGLSYDKNSDLSAVCSYNGRVSVYKSNTMNKVFEFSNDKSKSSIHLFSNKSLGYTCELICGHFNGLVEVYNVNTNVENPVNNLVAKNDRYTDTVTSVTTDDSGRVIVTGGYDKVVTLYENFKVDPNLDEESISETNKSKKRGLNQNVLSQLGTLENHTKPVTKLKFSTRNGYTLLSSSMDWYLCTWDLEKKKLVSSHNTGKPVTCFAVSPLGSEVCTGSNDGSMVVWDLRSNDSSVSLNEGQKNELNLTKKSLSRPFNRLVSDVSWNPSVSMVSAIGMDGNVILMDVRSPKFPLQVTHCEYKGESDRGTCTSWISYNDVVYTTASGLVNKLNYKEIKP